MGLGNVAIMLGSGIAGSVIGSDAKIGDLLSGAGKFLKKHGKDGDGAKSDSDTASLLNQVSTLREEINSLASKPVTVVTNAAKSGPGGYTITAVVVAGVIGYAYIKWKGWKLSDMMFVTRRGLADACNVVGSQLDQVSDTVVVTRKHLDGRIDGVHHTLDENQQIIEGTRDEVAVIHGDLSAFQEDLQSVTFVVRTLESKMGRLEFSQDQTVDGIHHLCEFTRKLEPLQNGNIGQATCLPGPAPRLALEGISSVAEPPTAESPNVSPAAENSRAEELQEQKVVVGRTWSTSREGSSHARSSSTLASANTPNPASSSRFGGLRLPGLGFLMGASPALT